MKTSRLFLVVISSVLMAVVYSCGSSNEKSSDKAASADSAPVSISVPLEEEKTAHDQLLSEGWSYLGRVEVDEKLADDAICFLEGHYEIYFKDGHYTAIENANETGYVPRYPVRKGTYRLNDFGDKYTYTGKFIVDGIYEYYFNF